MSRKVRKAGEPLRSRRGTKIILRRGNRGTQAEPNAVPRSLRRRSSRAFSWNQGGGKVMQQGRDRDDSGGQGTWDALRRSIGGYVYGSGTNSPEGRGGRRQKIAEYVRAANELRLSYYTPPPPPPPPPAPGGEERSTLYGENSYEQPSSEELMEYVASGKEEIVLFPSYGRKIIAQSMNSKFSAAPSRYPQHTDNVAEVDIRGWIYTPHTAAPPTRKNRVLMAMTAKLCGLPAIPDPNTASLGQGTNSGPNLEHVVHQNPNIRTSPNASSTYSTLGAAASKISWIGSRFTQPNSSSRPLTRSEIEQLHNNMQARISPFLTTPAFHMPLTVFFYNDKGAESITLRTDNLGHFTLRKPLPFSPTHVRILAGESLCAEEEIRYINPVSGISIISDIDDTIKISGVGSGLREMFRNVFVREMSTMPVPGVADWFNDLASPPLSAEVHYLSNSPWHLFPFLKTLLIDHMKLPKGTWHLKKYSGFVQGIFEPVVERKKESLDSLMRDFPGRKWVLVGDGGEGDLEVYTDVVKKWPGKVIAVYIRDVSGIGEKVVGTGTPAGTRHQFFSGNLNLLAEGHSLNPGRGQEHSSSVSTPPLHYASSDNSRVSPAYSNSVSQTTRKIPPPIPPKPEQLRSRRIDAVSNSHENLIELDDESSESMLALSGNREYRTLPPKSPKLSAPLKPNPSPDVPKEYPTVSQDQTQQPKLLDKKAELWKKRWEYAGEVLASQGVLLRSWKVGQDVHEECVALVKAYLKL